MVYYVFKILGLLFQMSATGQTRAALAAAKAKAAKEHIQHIWAAKQAVECKGAKKTSAAEVAAALQDVQWQPEYIIAGKNTHVCKSNVNFK